MITVFGCALAIPDAVDLADSTFVPLDDLPRPIDRSRLARSDQWKGRRRVISGTSASAAASVATFASARRFGNTAFEICRTWTLVGQSFTFALRRPTAVATATTSGFGAALDIVWRTGTGVADVLPSCRGAFSGRNAHTGSITTPRTGTVQNGPLSKISGMDNANAKIGRSECKGDEKHFSNDNIELIKNV